MSIEYHIFNFDGPLPSDEIMNAKDYRLPPLGDVDKVKEKIARYLPEIEWFEDRPFVGYTVDNHYLIEFYLSPDETGLVHGIGVFPYGIAEAEAVMRKFCLPNEWYVFDPQIGEWLYPSELTKWETNQTLKTKVMRKSCF